MAQDRDLKLGVGRRALLRMAEVEDAAQE